jgi:hypothetical protein
MGRKGASKGQQRQEGRRRLRKVLNSIGDVLTGKIPNLGRFRYGGGITKTQLDEKVDD